MDSSGSILGRRLTGLEYVRDLHSDLFPAMAHHSLKFTGSLLHFRAFFNAVFYSTRKQLPRRQSHRHSSNVASAMKNPIVVVAIEVHDIELLKRSG
jgi:hypothetical protein